MTTLPGEPINADEASGPPPRVKYPGVAWKVAFFSLTIVILIYLGTKFIPDDSIAHDTLPRTKITNKSTAATNPHSNRFKKPNPAINRNLTNQSIMPSTEVIDQLLSHPIDWSVPGSLTNFLKTQGIAISTTSRGSPEFGEYWVFRSIDDPQQPTAPVISGEVNILPGGNEELHSITFEYLNSDILFQHIKNRIKRQMIQRHVHALQQETYYKWQLGDYILWVNQSTRSPSNSPRIRVTLEIDQGEE